MAIIQELSLFDWKNFHDDAQTLGDLERLRLVIETMPDGKLMKILSSLRGNGRNDYPVAPVWNSVLAGIVFEHASVESLRRELQRNAQLREMCGFNPIAGVNAVPSKSAYSRFLTNLLKHESLVREMFDCLVEELTEIIPNFGTNVAGDGKPLPSFGSPVKKEDGDQRRDEDADWGKKVSRGVNADGKAWEKIKSWFGFRVHLIIDADAELPVAYTVTKASTGEQPVMRQMFADLKTSHPRLIKRCKHAMLDKGYDGTKMVCGLWDKYGIKPIIDIRNLWKDKEKTRQLTSKKIDNVTYDYKGGKLTVNKL